MRGRFLLMTRSVIKGGSVDEVGEWPFGPQDQQTVCIMRDPETGNRADADCTSRGCESSVSVHSILLKRAWFGRLYPATAESAIACRALQYRTISGILSLQPFSSLFVLRGYKPLLKTGFHWFSKERPRNSRDVCFTLPAPCTGVPAGTQKHI